MIVVVDISAAGWATPALGREPWWDWNSCRNNNHAGRRRRGVSEVVNAVPLVQIGRFKKYCVARTGVAEAVTLGEVRVELDDPRIRGILSAKIKICLAVVSTNPHGSNNHCVEVEAPGVEPVISALPRASTNGPVGTLLVATPMPPAPLPKYK